MNDLPVIIVGAGLVGLTLAQALKSEGIPYEIYERDEAMDSRYGGWAISLHWAIQGLKTCLPAHVYDQIASIHVHPEAAKQATIPFVYLDLKTGEPKFSGEVPPHQRVHRLKLRELLADGIEVKWGKICTGYEFTERGVVVSFSDGTETEGCLLAGVDGKNSKIKSMAIDAGATALYDLPVGFIGLKIRGTENEMGPLLSTAPILWQGTHSETRVFLFCSRIAHPGLNGTSGSEREIYEVQLNVGWMQKDGKPATPPSNEGKIAKLRELAVDFYDELRTTLVTILDDQEVLDIKLQDWPTETWNSCEGKVVILGDAAHPMTMYRGEAANHGMFDAVQLAKQLGSVKNGEKSLAKAVGEFQSEMIPRARKAVLLSRQACYDSHDLPGLTPSSPLLTIARELGSL